MNSLFKGIVGLVFAGVAMSVAPPVLALTISMTPPADPPKVNGAPFTEATLTILGLFAYVDDPDLPIIVLDSGSPDDDRIFIATVGGPSSIISDKVPDGTQVLRMIGTALDTSGRLALMSFDMTFGVLLGGSVQPGTVDRVTKFVQEETTLAVPYSIADLGFTDALDDNVEVESLIAPVFARSNLDPVLKGLDVIVLDNDRDAPWYVGYEAPPEHGVRGSWGLIKIRVPEPGSLALLGLGLVGLGLTRRRRRS